jgi:hypothetical protein
LVLTEQESEHATDRHIAIQRFRLGAILDGILEHALAMLVLCWMDHPSRSMGQRLKNRGGCFGSRSGGGYFGDSQAVRTAAINDSRPSGSPSRMTMTASSLHRVVLGQRRT